MAVCKGHIHGAPKYGLDALCMDSFMTYQGKGGDKGPNVFGIGDVVVKLCETLPKDVPCVKLRWS